MEKSPDLAGRGVRPYVKVLRGSIQEKVAHASADKTSGEAVAMEPVEGAQSIRAYLLSRDSMFFPWDNSWFQAIDHSIPD